MKVSRYEDLFSLKDKVVVLTGAGGGIVGTMARVIAQCGAKVAMLDISEQSVKKISKKIIKEGNCAIALRADVLNKSSLESACQKIITEFGKIDCLVNGAGGNSKDATTSENLSFFDIPIEANKKTFDLNFFGTLLSCQVFGKEIVKQEKGSIVNIASVAGYRPLTRAPAYAAAKAAVINFTKWLSVHMAQNYRSEIRVNAISPGFCLTKQNRYMLFGEKGNVTERGRDVLKSVPQSRFGESKEFVSTAILLLSDSASFVTGSVVGVDGGFDAFCGV